VELLLVSQMEKSLEHTCPTRVLLARKLDNKKVSDVQTVRSPTMLLLVVPGERALGISCDCIANFNTKSPMCLSHTSWSTRHNLGAYALKPLLIQFKRF
jgi:hypothetical protein